MLIEAFKQIRNMKTMKSIFTIAILLSVFGSFAQVDEQATKDTKELYSYLKSSAKKGVLFGAQTSTSMGIGWVSDKANLLQSDLQESAGRFPAIVGFDFHKWNFNLDNGWNTDVEQIKALHKKGAIVAFSWHTPNPVTGKGCKDLSGNPMKEILPGGSKNELFKSWMDSISVIANLCEVEGIKVPMIMRPFHENTGGWFWWGKQNSPELYKEVFRYFVDYMRNEKDIHSFLYCYSPAKPQSREHFLATYPGDDYVDILAFDSYLNDNPE